MYFPEIVLRQPNTALNGAIFIPSKKEEEEEEEEVTFECFGFVSIFQSFK